MQSQITSITDISVQFFCCHLINYINFIDYSAACLAQLVALSTIM